MAIQLDKVTAAIFVSIRKRCNLGKRVKHLFPSATDGFFKFIFSTGKKYILKKAWLLDSKANRKGRQTDRRAIHRIFRALSITLLLTVQIIFITWKPDRLYQNPSILR